MGLVLMQPADAAHEEHCASHPVDAAQQAPGHHDEGPAPDSGDCDHATMEACAAMSSCATLTAEPQRVAASVSHPGAARVFTPALAPTFRTSAPETPPPRA